MDWLRKISLPPVVLENLRIAIGSIRTNMVRSILTMFIIAFGIMALVGILTSIDAIKGAINTQFAFMGANTFAIQSRGVFIQIGSERYRSRNYSYISYKQAEDFKKAYNFPATVSISVFATSTGTVKFAGEKTDPNIRVMGVDENYLLTAGYEIDKGRFFLSDEILRNVPYAVIGKSLERKLFRNQDPIDKLITVGAGKYRVIGVLKEKGSGFGGGSDEICLLAYTNVRQYFSRPRMNYSINVRPDNPNFMDAAIGEAEGVFRIVRNLNVKDESDFNIVKSDNLARILIKNIRYVTLAATVIGIITLFGAAVGLMNIMLVSVTERTTEIGIRKAIGAKASTIRQQFLFEAILIGQFGGLAGTLLGMLIGNLVSMSMKSPFIVPWEWIISGVLLCFLVGLVSGYFPAQKAAKVDPIVSLHYE
ncbi:MAG TPA: ABC transporter permease [Bacteroidales bacterium]|nr:ABC transporter permease [Bacteroidales bacterium]